jgi:hypothetical protein
MVVLHSNLEERCSKIKFGYIKESSDLHKQSKFEPMVFSK